MGTGYASPGDALPGGVTQDHAGRCRTGRRQSQEMRCLSPFLLPDNRAVRSGPPLTRRSQVGKPALREEAA